MNGDITAAAINPWIVWSPSIASIASTMETAIITGLIKGKSQITYTNSNGCSKNIDIKVYELPTITGLSSLCEGTTLTLTGSVTAHASTPWTSSSPTFATINGTLETATINGLVAGTTTITFKNTNGCSNTKLITINSLPNITGTASLCVGTNITLNGSATAAIVNPWTTDLSGFATVSGTNETATISGISAGNTVITYTNTNGCSKTSTITVNPLPTITGKMTLCKGGGTTLIGSATSQSWSSFNNSIASITNTGDVSANSKGSVKITYTNTNGCKTDTTLTIVQPLINTLGQFEVCKGSGISVAGNLIGKSPNPWSTLNNSIAEISNIGIVTGKNPGSVKIQYETDNGCKTDTLITVHALPDPSITADGVLSFCKGKSVNLSVKTYPTITWNNNSSATKITVTSSGKYYVQVTDNKGCTDISDTTTITVFDPPIVSITPLSSTTFCDGNEVKLQATSGSSYLWSTGETTQEITTKINGNYSVKVTDNHGCYATSTTKTVSVLPLPTAEITKSGSTTFCEGDSISLTAKSGTYSWIKDGQRLNKTSETIYVSNQGSYEVEVTGSNGCKKTALAVTITVNPKPVASITSSGSTQFCKGNKVTLTASSGASYHWLKNGIKLNITKAAIDVEESGDYSVEVISLNGCKNTSSATKVIVNPLPTPTITENGALTFCQGGSVELTSSLAQNYLWSTNQTSQKITVNTSGTYSVKTADANGCIGESIAKVVIVNQLPILTPSSTNVIICKGSSPNIKLESNIANTTFDWTVLQVNATGGSNASNVPNNSSITQILTTTQNQGTVTYNITPKSNGCLGSIVQVLVTVKQIDNPSFDYNSKTYCSNENNPIPKVTGTTGGEFSVIPSNANLIIDKNTGVINLSASLPGNYTIGYKTSGTCPQNSTTSITIKETPIVNKINDTTLCEKGTFNKIQFKGTSGATFNWFNDNTKIGLTATGSSEIPSFTGKGTSYGSASTIANITVTPTLSGCTGTSKTIKLTVNSLTNPEFSYSDNSYCTQNANPTPTTTNSGGIFSVSPSGMIIDSNTGLIDLSKSSEGYYSIKYTTNGICPTDTTITISIGNPTINKVVDQTICEGSYFNSINFFGSTGTVFEWINDKTNIGLSSSGTGNILTFKASGTIVGGPTITSTIIVTPRAGVCIGKKDTFELSVTPKENPSFLYPEISFCRTLDSNPSANITGMPGGVFSIVPASNSLNPNNGLIELSKTISGKYILRYTTPGVCKNTQDLSITIGDNPSVDSIKNQTICNGSDFNKIVFSGTAGSSFTWTNTNTSIGLAASGNGTEINAFKGLGITASKLSNTATIKVTPKVGSCKGTPKEFTLTVNNSDNVGISYSDKSFCNKDSISLPIISGTKTGVFSSTPTGLSINPASGKITAATSINGEYKVMYKTTGACADTAIVDVNINSNPTVDHISSITACQKIILAKIEFTGTKGTTFDWENSNTAIGLASSGTKYIDTFTTRNPSPVAISGTIKVTPRSGSCIGVPELFTITVTPTDDATFNYSVPSLCHNASELTPTVNGTKTGIFTSGTGLTLDKNTGSIKAATSTPGNYLISYVTTGACPKSGSATIKINEKPYINTLTLINQTVCEGSLFNSISINGSQSAEFLWTNSNTSIGLISNGTGSINSFIGTGTKISKTPQTGVIKILPKIDNCIGDEESFLLIVSNLDDPTFSYTDNSFCKTQLNPTPKITGTQGGEFSSTNGLSIDKISGTINLSASNSGTYVVTYKTKGLCPQNQTDTISIGIAPDITSISGDNQSICQNSNFNDIVINGAPGSIYEWVNTNTAIGLAASGSTTSSIKGFSATGTLINGASVSAKITITPKIGSCIGKTKDITLTTNPLDNPEFKYANTSFCKSESNQNPTITGLTNGLFSSNPIGLSISSAGTIDVKNSTSGDYDVSYKTQGTCPNTKKISISIGELPNVTAVNPQIICQGDFFKKIVFSGNAGTVFEWTNTNPSIGLASSGKDDIQVFKGVSSGSATISVTPLVGVCKGESKTFSLTVNPIINTSINYPKASYCLSEINPNTIPIVSGSTKGKFTSMPSGLSLDSLTGKIDLSKTLAGDYDIFYTVIGICTNNSTTKVAIGSLPTLNAISSQEICNQNLFQTINFTGNTGTQFNWTNSNSLIGLPNSGSGDIASFKGVNTSNSIINSTIQVTPVIGACSGTSKTMQLSILPTDDPSFSYSKTELCNNDLDIQANSIMTSGGEFSSSPSGLDIDATSGKIKIKTSLAQTYNITYATKGKCPKATTKTIELIPLPKVDSILNQEVCQNDTFSRIQFKGSTSTIFSWTNTNTTIGLTQNGTSTINSFKGKGTSLNGGPITSQITVIPTIKNCKGSNFTFTLTVNSIDAPYFSYLKKSYCPSDNNPIPSLGGSPGVFSSSPNGLVINNLNGQVDLMNSTANKFMIKYTTKGKCKRDSTVELTINPKSTVNLISDQKKCYNDSFNIPSFTGTPALVKYIWVNNNPSIGLSQSGVGNIAKFAAKGTIPGGPSIEATILVTPEINGCFGPSQSFKLNVDARDKADFSYNDNSFCKTQVNPFATITGKQGGTFSATPTGLIFLDNKKGTIDLIPTKSGTYSITYTTNGTCVKDSSITIGIGEKPSVEDIDDQQICQGQFFDKVIFKGNAGTMFNWKNSNKLIGLDTIAGNSFIPSFEAKGTIPGSIDAIATIKVYSRIGTCIGDSTTFKYKTKAKPNIKARIVTNPLNTKILKDTSYCKGGSAKLIASGAAKDADYHWSPHTSTVGNQFFGASVTAIPDSTQQFIVFGQNQYGCSNTDTIQITIYNPSINNINDTSICYGNNFKDIQFKGPLLNTKYTWKNNNTLIGLSATGSTKIDGFTGKITAGKTSEKAIITVTPSYTIITTGKECNGVAKTFNLTVNSRDKATFSGIKSQYCNNENSIITPSIDGTKGGVFSSIPVGLAINSTTGQLFPSASKANNYQLKYVTKGICNDSSTLQVEIKPLVLATIQTSGNDTLCMNAIEPEITFKGLVGTQPYTFTYKINNGPELTTTTEIGKSEIKLKVPTSKEGSFTYSLISIKESSGQLCSNEIKGTKTIVILPLPKAILSGATTLCEGSSPTNVTFTGLNGSTPFTFTYAINGTTQNTIATLANEASVTVPVNTSKPGVLTYSLIGVKDGTKYGCSQTQFTSPSIAVTIKTLPTATIKSGFPIVCMNGANPEFEFNGINGTSPYTFIYKINNGNDQTITTKVGESKTKLILSSANSASYVIKLISVKDASVNTCLNDNLSIKDSIKVIPGAYVNPLVDTNICVNEMSKVITFNGSIATKFHWSIDNGSIGVPFLSGINNIPSFKGLNNSDKIANTANVTVNPKSDNGCIGEPIKFTISIRPIPKPTIDFKPLVCPGDSVVLKAIGPYKFTWVQDNNTLSCFQCGTTVAKPIQTTEYKVIATSYECDVTFPVLVIVNEPPQVYGRDTTLCGDPSPIELIGYGAKTYTWSNGIKNGESFVPKKGKSQYIVTGINDKGCKNSDTVNVYVLTKPKAFGVPSTTSGYNPLFVSVKNESSNATNYTWNFGNGEPIIYSSLKADQGSGFSKTGIYTITLKAFNGLCVDSIDFLITVKKRDTMLVTHKPNVFTPNGDGDNDYFNIKFKNAETIYIQIFNRWGNVIHEITEKTETWDGLINGSKADEGVYFYNYVLKDIEGEKLTGQGFVQLLR